jgi:hypothetical protein
MERMRGGAAMGVGWASGEASDLAGPPLNLVLYMHLRIFAYTSNILISSFEYTEWMLVSGTLKNFRFLLRSCLFTESAPVIKLICSTSSLDVVSPHLWHSGGIRIGPQLCV